MKNRGFIIALIILLVIVILSLVWLLISCISGKSMFFNGFARKSENLVYDEIYDISEIKEIDVSSNAGDITFKESSSDEIKVMVYAKNKEDASVELDGSVLNVKNDVTNKSRWFNFNTYLSEIIIYIPKDFENKISIKNNYGDCTITALKEASLDIHLDCGDLKIEDIKNVNINSNYGDVKISNILNKCTIDSSCGDIKIENLELKEDSSINSDFGNVKIKKVNNIYIDAKVDLGDVKIEDNARHSDITLKIKSDCGDIKVGE